jgi:hypothetical protein
LGLGTGGLISEFVLHGFSGCLLVLGTDGLISEFVLHGFDG